MNRFSNITGTLSQIFKIGKGANTATFTADETQVSLDKILSVSKVTGLAAPSADGDAANKKYVDGKAAAVDTSVAIKDDGTAKGNVTSINVVDSGANVKATVAVSGKAATITMSHATPSGGTATGNSGANVIANVTKTGDGHITNVASVEVTPALIGAQPAAAALTSLAGAAAGIMVKTSATAATPREIKAGNGVTVTNGTGVSGNPTIAVANGSTSAKGIVQLTNAAGTSTTTAATPAAVKAVQDAAVLKAGSTMTGALTLSGAPTQANHAATKAYVDAIAQGLNIHEAARVATTGNITLSGTQTIDGIAVVAGDRVLVRAQTDSKNDGVYVVNANAWTRAEDCNEAGELTSFYVFVLEGNTYGGFGFNQTTTFGTVGTTAQTWEIFNKPAEFTVVQSTGITVTQSGRKFTVAAKAASTSAAGIVQLNNATNSTSTSQAATANAVKLVKDAVDALDTKTMDLVTGATENAIATFNASGQVKNSGRSILGSSTTIASSTSSTALVGAKQVSDFVTSKVNAAVTKAEVKMIKLPIATATKSSTTNVPANAVILSTALVVTTAYTAGATIAITAGGTSVMTAAENDPTLVAYFEGASGVMAGSTAAKVTATVGGSPTAGAGYVIVTYTTTAQA